MHIFGLHDTEVKPTELARPVPMWPFQERPEPGIESPRMVGPQIIPWYHLINIECNATDLPLDALVEECSKVRRLVAQRTEECEWAYEGHSHFPNSQSLRHTPIGRFCLASQGNFVLQFLPLATL